MSTEEPVFNGGIDNVDFDDIITDTKDSNGGPGARFRISRLPTEQEIQEIPLQAVEEENTDSVNESTDSVQSKPDGGKHVHLNIPSDHNETTQQRNNTHTQTLGYLTHDAVPLSVFYRNQASMENATGGDTRPTLDQLHKGEGLENAKKRHWVSFIFLIKCR